MTARLLMTSVAMHDAEKDFERVLREDYPVGAQIQWMRNERVFSGHVLQHAYGTRILVQNERTTRPLWIYGADVVNAFASLSAEAA